MSFSPRSFFINFSVLSSVKYLISSQDKLTESSLLDLLGCKSESREQFYDDLHQNVCQGWRRRDSGINTKSGEEIVEGRKEIQECIIASTDVFDRLLDLNVTEIS